MTKAARDFAPGDAVRVLEDSLGWRFSVVPTDKNHFYAATEDGRYQLRYSKTSTRLMFAIRQEELLEWPELLEFAQLTHKSGFAWGVISAKGGPLALLNLQAKHQPRLLEVLTTTKGGKRPEPKGANDLMDPRFVSEAETFHFPARVTHRRLYPGLLEAGGVMIMSYGKDRPTIAFGATGQYVHLPKVHCDSEFARVIRACPQKRVYEPHPHDEVLQGQDGPLWVKWPYNVNTLLVLATGMMVYGEEYPGQFEDEDLPEPTHTSGTVH
ncbi:MAG: hypothetical protein ACRC8R_12100 [Aeromonas hydrophila]